MTISCPRSRSTLPCLAAALLLPALGVAQEVIGTHEKVPLDSPEGWAMAYMIASSLNLSQLPPESVAPGDVRFAVEAGSIPRLNEDQQRVGFGGFKAEDLNKSPAFGRARVGIGLPWEVMLELAWTPPLEIDGARPEGLWGVALSRPLLSVRDWRLGLRAFAQQGEVSADVTCSADVAAQTPGSAGNPLSCLEPSNDILAMDHYGAELILSRDERGQPWQPYLSVASTRLDPFTEVNALVLGVVDRSTIDSEGTTTTFSVGVGYRLGQRWRVTLATSYTPFDVQRPAGNPGGQDNFWNLRLGLSWDL
ncbi:MAG: hypothetical protein WD396_04180 [Pseudohongiellaceae bacterium]